jgi:hypothetical protein
MHVKEKTPSAASVSALLLMLLPLGAVGDLLASSLFVSFLSIVLAHPNTSGSEHKDRTGR